MVWVFKSTWSLSWDDFPQSSSLRWAKLHFFSVCRIATTLFLEQLLSFLYYFKQWDHHHIYIYITTSHCFTDAIVSSSIQIHTRVKGLFHPKKLSTVIIYATLCFWKPVRTFVLLCNTKGEILKYVLVALLHTCFEKDAKKVVEKTLALFQVFLSHTTAFRDIQKQI